ncbi:MAG: hypothetical protein ACQEXI_16895 [Pseudomonadota bacterium]
MAWVIYLGIQELHPGSESWLAEWGRMLSLSSAMSAIEEGETSDLVTLLPQGESNFQEPLSLWLRQHPETHCTLVYPQPSLTIAQQLQQGEELEVTCRRWKQQAQMLLSLFRQHRRQLSLWTWPAAAHTPEDGAPDQVPLPKGSANNEIEPIYTLLAHQALSQGAELAEAVRYLAASTLNDARSQRTGPNLSAILEHHRQDQRQQRQDQQAHAEALQTLREERDQASQHSDERQKSLDRLKKQADEQHERLEDLQARHDEAQAACQAQEKENALLLEQLHGVQEKLEQALLDRQDLERQLAEAKTAQAELEKRLEQSQAQLKTEQTNAADLKQERDRLLAERDQLNDQRNESEEENALLLEQLHGVQEKLEQALLKRQDLEKQLDEAKTAQAELDKRLEQSQEQLKTEQTNAADLKQERDRLLAERDQLNDQRNESEEENTLLLEQLHFVQEELERHILDHRDQKSRYTEQNSALQHQLTELQQAHQQQELLVQWLQAFATRTNSAFYKKRPSVLKEHKALLASSASFDADWYARTYPDVVESGIEPAVHYLKFGMLEGRNPSAEFNTRHYITAHPDIAAAGEHPLLHYIRWGRDEQRQALPQPLAEEAR